MVLDPLVGNGEGIEMGNGQGIEMKREMGFGRNSRLVMRPGMLRRFRNGAKTVTRSALDSGWGRGLELCT